MRVIKGKSPGGKIRFRRGVGLALARDSETGDPSLPASPGITRKEWNPDILNRLKSCKKVRIAQLRVGWSQLEFGLGNYVGGDWDKLDQWLDDTNFSEADGGPKDISVLINTKLFHQNWNIVPNYMLPYHATNNPTGDPGGATYSGGQADYPATPGFVAGRVLRFDNVNVQARLTALANEIGRRYKNNPRIHIVGVPESSYGQEPSGFADADAVEAFYQLHFAGVKVFLQALRTALPQTIIRAICNYERRTMSTWIPALATGGSAIAGLALGNPNSAHSEPGLGINTPYKGFFQHIKDLDGIVIKIAEMQRPEMGFDNLDNRIRPASTWGALTLGDRGDGYLQLRGFGDHGLAIGNTVDTIDAGGGIQLTGSGAGGFPAGYLDVISVDSAKNVTVVNRAAWSGGLAAGDLRFSHVASRGLTSPASAVRLAQAGGYPYDSYGFTYDPGLPGDYTGYVPSKKQLFDFVVEDLGAHYIMITFDQNVNTRSGLANDEDFFRYIDAMAGNHTFGGGLSQTIPSNIT